jgi:hypothetical protein
MQHLKDLPTLQPNNTTITSFRHAAKDKATAMTDTSDAPNRTVQQLHSSV